MVEKYLLGIDIGTSGAKAAIIDTRGQLVGSTLREYPILTPYPDWAEQDPQMWLGAATECIRLTLRQTNIDASQITGIGLAGQMHGLVCVDKHGETIRPAIIWADQRSGLQVDCFMQVIGKENLAVYTGNPLATGFMLASWLWLRDQEKETTEKTRWLLLPKDYVRFKMTGKVGSEPSDASATLLYDPHQNQWSRPILEHIGLPEDQLPPIYPSAEIAGGLTKEFADSCGLLPGTPVVYGGSDVTLQAMAQGMIFPGFISCTIGTGGQLFAPVAAPQHDPDLRMHLFCHVLPDAWHHEVAILSAGLALRWLRDGLWPAKSYQALADEALTVEAGLEGLFFFPFLLGERTPYMNPNLAAGFLGMTLRHRHPHLVRAVMEGVVFELRQGLDLMKQFGTPVKKLVVSGGGTKHPLWLQLQADIFQQPVFLAEDQEATARGAGILAGVGVGMYHNVQDATRATIREPVLGAAPDSERSRRYQEAYNRYKEIADTIVNLYAKQS